MPRLLTVGVEAALAAGNVPLLLFVELVFDGGTVRVTNAGHDIPWDGNTWLGTANCGEISGMAESTALEASAVTLRLSAINSALLATMVGDHYQGRAARIWIAPLDADHQVLADPVGPWSYLIDNASIRLAETGEIVLNLQSRMAAWARPKVRRYSNEEQQARYPGDRGLEYITQMVEKELRWGPL